MYYSYFRIGIGYLIFFSFLPIYRSTNWFIQDSKDRFRFVLTWNRLFHIFYLFIIFYKSTGNVLNSKLVMKNFCGVTSKMSFVDFVKISGLKSIFRILIVTSHRKTCVKLRLEPVYTASLQSQTELLISIFSWSTYHYLYNS